MQTERRALPLFDGSEVEMRAGKEFTGLAAVYYDGTEKTQYNLTSEIIERVHKGAFDAVLANGSDVFGLYDHRDDMMLGRRSSGTLRIESNDKGLAYAISYDDSDPIHQTISARIRRKDVRGSSVTWRVMDTGQTFERRNDGKIIRNINRVDLLVDVGPVPTPAYSATSAEMRSQVTDDQIVAIMAAAQRSFLAPPTPIEFYFAQRGQR